VIDLTRLPSHGRGVAEMLRQQKATRFVPLLFVGGEPEKVARAREHLPDAVFCEWKGIRGALREAMKNPPADPVVPDSMAGYSGTPLPKKLGIKPGSVTGLIGAPDRFERKLEPLPDGAQLQANARGADTVLLFITSSAEMELRFLAMEKGIRDGGKVWIIWPKQASGMRTDLNQAVVRAFALAREWVDYKVCAVDATWSGLLFTRRKN
jgi:hypothetical protein